MRLLPYPQTQHFIWTGLFSHQGSKGRSASNVFAKLPKKTMQEMKEVMFPANHNAVSISLSPSLSLWQAIRSKKEGEPKRAHRAPSNVFAMFRQSQVQEFKEVWETSSTNSRLFGQLLSTTSRLNTLWYLT